MPNLTDTSTLRPETSTSRRERRRSSGIRKDIQGLRALAVGVVVLDHMIKWPTGGYVGVDVFFVISGFLITGLLLREHARSGTISFVDFYRRRLRRITPVAVLVLAVTVLTIFLIYGVGRTKTVLEEAVYSLLFAANWHFAVIGTDYMQANGPVSPLQHYWSLAVEEQFYIVWPVVILIVLGVSARRFRLSGMRALRVLRLVLVILTAGSFVYACWQSRAEPTWAYFSTLSRGWELGVGALVATLTSRLAMLPRSVRPILARSGLVGILGSVVFLDSNSVFPAPWGAVPVVSAALVIAAQTGTDRPSPSRLLSLRPMQYVGKISYSLYLWHFPVVTVAAALVPQPQNVLTVVAQVAVMLVLSAASFHFLEDPVRKSNWLNNRGGSVDRVAVRRPISSGWSKVVFVGVGPACLALLATVVVSGVSPSVPAGAGATQDVKGLSVDPLQRADQIRNSLEAETWPTLVPAVDDLTAKARVPEWEKDSCLNVGEADLSRCLYGDKGAGKTAVLVGDSIAISYMTGLRAAFAGSDWKIQSLTLEQCPAIDISVLTVGAAAYPECDKHHEWVQNYLAKLHPDLIIMSSHLETVSRLASGTKGHDAVNAWTQATGDTLQQFAPLARKVVLMESPPKGVVLPWCATAINSPKDCIAVRTPEQVEMQSAELGAVPSGAPNVSSLDTTSWFCDRDNRCPSFVGNTPVFADGSHLTENYSKMLGPVLRSALLDEAK
jgi:peptidoglycan/LPS O-acetylase OafA/YrhL